MFFRLRRLVILLLYAECMYIPVFSKICLTLGKNTVTGKLNMVVGNV